MGVIGEDALWARGQEGDAEAFAGLFDMHHSRVYGRALRLLGDRTDAEDVTAAAFLELWRRRSVVRVVDGSVLPWLLVTTTNLTRNSQRGTRRYRRLLASLPREAPTAHGADVALEEAALADGELAIALRGLPARDAHLVTLVALEDLTIADAAAVLGMTASAAKSRLHRSRARLREALAGHPAALRQLAAAEGATP